MEFIFLLKRSLLFWLEIWLAGARISSLKPLYSPEMDFTGHLRLTFFFIISRSRDLNRWSTFC